MGMVEERKLDGLLSPTSITTLHYLGKKALGEESVCDLIKKLMAIFAIGYLDRRVIERSLESKVSDFEDAILEGLAALQGADCIATRNTRDFRNSIIPAKEPIEVIRQIHSVEGQSG